MRIVVCVKQVPLVSRLKFDPETRRLVREGVPNEVNPFDAIAMTEAVAIKERYGGEVIAITMGPPQAREALVQCLAMGADRALHLVDRAFAGSDTFATSRALALAIEREHPDLILCGRSSVDAETGQVGPELAERLDLPQVTAVRRLQFDEALQYLVAERETDEGIETIQCPLPALVTAAESLCEESWPSPEALQAAEAKPIQTITAADLHPDPSQFGAAGSPTWVREIRSIESPREGIMVQEEAGVAATRLAQYLLDQGLFDTWKIAPAPVSRPPSSQSAKGNGATWVVGEIAQGKLRPVTLELLGAARELAQTLGGTVAALLLGTDLDHHVPTLAAHGADQVFLAEDDALATYETEAVTHTLAEAISRFAPWAILIPSTARGRDFAPRVAARLGLGLTGDCIGLELDDEGQLVQLKPALGGNIVAPILSKTTPAMATVRPGILPRSEPDWSRQAEVVQLKMAPARSARTRLLSSKPLEETAGFALESAEVVVGVGMGIGGPEHLPTIQRLSAVMGAAVGASRNVTDAGWLPKQLQVGLTGRAIAPRLYLAIGISGNFNHMVGVQRAGRIVAINRNPRAPIFRAADFGVVGDWAQVVPPLQKALEKAKAS